MLLNFPGHSLGIAPLRDSISPGTAWGLLH
jgi:hypothetical protein